MRTAGVYGCILTFIGTTLKLFSLHTDRFYIVGIGQIVLAIANVLVACLPSKLAAVWFSSNEVSKITLLKEYLAITNCVFQITIACSLGVFGSQIGVALGYIVPPIIVNNHDSPETIGAGLHNLCWTLSMIILPVTLVVIFCKCLNNLKPNLFLFFL